MNNSNLNANWRLALYVLTCTILASSSAFGARVSDVRGTKHNLSAVADGAAYPGGTVPARTVKATSETQVCVFCHTPHGSTLGVTALWNRKLSSATYTPYTSSSLDAAILQPGDPRDPAGSSKLCLSCHDGTLAIGSVNVLNGLGGAVGADAGDQAIAMTGVSGASGVMADGSGTTTGYTRNLGVNLTNDHPISVTYTTALSDRDGELRSVDSNQKYPAGTGAIIGLRSPGLKPKAPLEPTGTAGAGQVQCSACHDPHLRETNEATVGNQKFLRLNRFQEVAPTTAYNDVSDINCVACHDKNNDTAGTWVYSAHANANLSQGAIQTYTAAAATQREFPADLPVWKASCLNCHDTHTVQGARWLLREGVEGPATPKTGGNSAIEETCYQCHSNDANTAITPLTTVPDIKADFALSRHMPITLVDQGNPASEAHDIGSNLAIGGAPYEWVDCSTSGSPTPNKCGADFVEKRTKLGAGNGTGNNLANRHAECTDCHNPHRVVKFQTFAPTLLSATPDANGHHPHTDAAAYTHTNIASGALRGTFGVEPVYASASFANLPTSYDVKRGDPGISTSALVTDTYVTREYQICLKCHSDYGYDDDNLPDGTTTNRPALGGSGLTPSGANSVTHYTNQAKEFQAPLAHQGAPTTTSDSGAKAPTYSADNYRSWHPVMDATGRTAALRGGMTAALFNLPWSNAVGTQTMYCSDCHGSGVTSGSSAIPDAGKSWGPHGSANDFILKGAFNSTTGTNQSGDVCFKCHSYNDYATATSSSKSGFSSATNINLHAHHVSKIGQARCNWCHTAVPHGWKNKALLVNLNDVGPEVQCRQQDADDQPTGSKCTVGSAMPVGTQMRNGPVAAGKLTGLNYWVDRGYTNPPYYLNALQKINTFRASGAWTVNDCGSAGAPGNGVAGCVAGAGWSTTSDESCKTAP